MSYRKLVELEKLNEKLLEALKKAIEYLTELKQKEKAEELGRVVFHVEERLRLRAENKSEGER